MSRNSYLYSMHGNYITGDVDKQQLIEDAGYWLVQTLAKDIMDNTHVSTARKGPDSGKSETGVIVSRFRCLRFPHETHSTNISLPYEGLDNSPKKDTDSANMNNKGKVSVKSHSEHTKKSNTANKKQRKPSSKRIRVA